MVRRAIQRLKDLIASGEQGQGMVEYAFIMVLVSIIAIVLVAIIGHQTSNDVSNISGSFPT